MDADVYSTSRYYEVYNYETDLGVTEDFLNSAINQIRMRVQTTSIGIEEEITEAQKRYISTTGITVQTHPMWPRSSQLAFNMAAGLATFFPAIFFPVLRVPCEEKSFTFDVQNKTENE